MYAHEPSGGRGARVHATGRLLPNRTCARSLSIDHSSSRVNSFASGVCCQFLRSRRRHATTSVKKRRRITGLAGIERSSTLSSSGRKCIAESMKRKHVRATLTWGGKAGARVGVRPRGNGGEGASKTACREGFSTTQDWRASPRVARGVGSVGWISKPEDGSGGTLDLEAHV